MTTQPLPAGSPAPDIEVELPWGFFRLSEQKDVRAIAVLFYPMAFTPVCTEELTEIGQAVDRFRAERIGLVGISVDSQDSANRFAAHLGFNEALPLVGNGEAIAKSFGVLRGEGFSERATFVLDSSLKVLDSSVSGLMAKRSPEATLDFVRNAVSP